MGIFEGGVDPCAFGCIFESFGQFARDWWEIFTHCARKGQDSKTKLDYYEIDYPSVAVVFDAFDVEDRREGLRLLRLIASELESSTVARDEWVLGLDDDQEE